MKHFFRRTLIYINGIIRISRGGKGHAAQFDVVGYDVSYWHLADNPATPAFVRYWSKSGHWSALALIGSVAIDPKRTFACDWLKTYEIIVSISRREAT
jgi:hypothetical protein